MPIDVKTGKIIKTGEKFDNLYYGLIVENTKNFTQKATYLPNVFPNQSWEHIKTSLIQKANITDKNIKFYAYDCIIRTASIADYFILPIQKFVNTYYVIFVPYMIKEKEVVIDKKDDVRNLGTIYSIFQMQQHYKYRFSHTANNTITSSIGYYKSKYKFRPNNMRQASAFLLLDLYLSNKDDEYIPIIKNNLYKELNQQNNFDSGKPTDDNFVVIEKNFELGKILTALNIVDPNNQILKNEINKIPIIDEELDVDIFRYNWFSKLVKNMNDKVYKYTLVKRIIGYYDDNKEKDETNYYAVEFEALATLYASISDVKTKKLVEQYIIKLIISLEKRKNKFGFYEFKNGETRLDITGHVLDGLYELMSLL
jgi:hypothetical protein